VNFEKHVKPKDVLARGLVAAQYCYESRDLCCLTPFSRVSTFFTCLFFAF
jgi:hypothetical protein